MNEGRISLCLILDKLFSTRTRSKENLSEGFLQHCITSIGEKLVSPPTMCHMSRVTCHVSHFMCHVSCVMSHVSRVTFVELVWGGSVINGAYPV